MIKKSVSLILGIMIAAMSVTSVSAAPRGYYFNQDGNKHWCNSDADGCWVTGENEEHVYIMFWSETSREKIMGPDSNAPLGIAVNSSEMQLEAPAQVKNPSIVHSETPTITPSSTPAPTNTEAPTEAPTQTPSSTPAPTDTETPTEKPTETPSSKIGRASCRERV